MISIKDSLQNSSYNDQHLELDFGKNSLNTTCASKSVGIESGMEPPHKDLNHDLGIKNSEMLKFQA